MFGLEVLNGVVILHLSGTKLDAAVCYTRSFTNLPKETSSASRCGGPADQPAWTYYLIYEIRNVLFNTERTGLLL